MSKYRAKPATLDGIRFDSKAEMRRYQQLSLIEKAGEISDLKIHPRFELQPAFVDRNGNKQRAIVYEADFSYFDKALGHTIIEDVKGYEGNRAWQLKYKMFLFSYRSYDLRVIK